MPILHMEVETVHETSRAMLRAATELHDLTRSLQYSVASLDSAWQSNSASDFTNDAKQIVRAIEQQIDELDVLSQRVMNEANQWAETDTLKSFFQGFVRDRYFSLDDAKYLLAGGYLASHLRWSSLRPNSMIFTGPNWMRDALDIKPMTRVIKPSTLAKKMAAVAYIQNLAEGAYAGVQTFNDPAYKGTDRAMPAAVLDGLVKTAILASGTTVLVGGTALIVASSAAPVVVGGAVIATWVAGDLILNKVVQEPLWQTWQHSYQRDQAIEGMTRFTNDVNLFMESKVQESARNVDQAFRGFIKDLLPT